MISPRKTEACSLCNSTQAEVVRSYTEPDMYETEANVSKSGYFRYWMRCSECGLYYSVYSRQSDELDKLYTTSYRSSSAPWRKGTPEETFRKVIALPEAESETKFRVRWIRQNIDLLWNSGILKRHSPPYRLLDVGGATGVFAYEFQDENWKSYVIDPDENGKFLESAGIRFLQKKYEPGSYDFTFDLIAFVFVLEHIPEPAGLLKDVRADMATNSLLYIEVPSNLAFKFKPPEDDIFNACHLWMFSADTLMRLLAQCGFEVVALNSTRTKRGHYSLMVLAVQA